MFSDFGDSYRIYRACELGLVFMYVSRLVVHDWERDYYRSGIKELGYKVENEVNNIETKSFSGRNPKKCQRILVTAID